MPNKQPTISFSSPTIIFERLNSNTAIVQENHYGAWGDVLEGIGTSGDWKFLYQGNEYVDAFGYNMSDFGWRQGDSWSGRWTSPDPADQFQNMTPYNFMGNNPVSQIDPDGQFVPVVIAGAAILGGASNLWSNWSKVKNWKQGLAYFGSGAIGGVVSLVGSPVAGGSTTALLNVGIDITTGNMPTFRNGWDVAKYAGGLALDGFGVAGAGQLSKLAYSGLSPFFSNAAISSVNGTIGFVKTASEVGSFALDATAELVVKPAIKGFGKPLISSSLRQGVNLIDDAGQGFSSMNRFKSVYGKAGQGQAWHHIVEQHADNIGQFGAESIHNTKNLIKLPEGAGSIHRKITGFYNSIQPEITGSNSLRVRHWLKNQSFEEQYKFGLEAIKRFSPK